MLKHTLKKVKEQYQLCSNGLPCNCPFRTGTPVQNDLGSVGFINQDCNSTCPHFRIEEEISSPASVLMDQDKQTTGRVIVTLTCGTYRPFSATIEEEPKSTFNIIN